MCVCVYDYVKGAMIVLHLLVVIIMRLCNSGIHIDMTFNCNCVNDSWLYIINS